MPPAPVLDDNGEVIGVDPEALRTAIDGWPLAAWINAETRDTLIAGLAEVARRLTLAGPDDLGDSFKAARLLRDHLNSRTADGLLVFDNAVSPGELRSFLPAAGPTQVVVTSTSESFRSLGTLSHRLYLGYVGYLRLLRTVPVDELFAAVDGSDYQRPVAAALLLSVATVEREDPGSLSGRLPRVIACLSPDGVPRDLLAGFTARQRETDEAVAQCTSSSILSWSGSGNELIMHWFLGRVLRERDLSAGRWPQTVTAALEPACFPDEEAWTRRQEGSRLTAQLEAAWDAASGLGPAALGLGGPRPRGPRPRAAGADAEQPALVSPASGPRRRPRPGGRGRRNE
ncbi:MAG: hypothetical protein ACRDN0_38420 [Trebonia sp.]